MSKKQIQQVTTVKLTKQTITEHIHQDFRRYALYTVESRAIPNFYDMLNPSKRVIIQNSPVALVKTLKVVGDCISDGYHHGDSNLGKTIGYITNTYSNAEPLLIGGGFFGNQINPTPSAPRYTSVKISPSIYNELKKYRQLNSKEEDDESWNPLHVEIPIGLATGSNGVAIGYTCRFLPRDLKDVRSYLDGTKKSIKPKFMGFNGKIEKNKTSQHTSSWLINPVVDVFEKERTLHIKEISPTIKYETFIANLNKVLAEHKCSVRIDSKKTIDIKISFNKNTSLESFAKIKDSVISTSTTVYTELIVIIKDKVVLEYDSMEDYLDDFRRYLEFLYLKQDSYVFNYDTSELEFLEAKLEFLKWMVVTKRKQNEIESFMKKYNNDIYSRLDNIKLRALNNEMVTKTISDIVDIKKKIIQDKKKLDKQNKVCSKIKNVIVNANKNKRS